MRFLQLGLGSMGKRRIRCVHALRAGEVIGVDARPDRLAEAEGLYGIQTADSFEEGMAAHPDAVIISTPPDLHIEYAMAALQAGIPFFAEETVALDPDELDPLIEATEKSPLVAAPSCTMRHHPGIQQVKRLIDADEIGEAFSFNAFCVSYLPDWHPWEGIGEFYVRTRRSGGGREMVLFEMDWLEWLFGNVTTVSAEVGALAGFPIDIDDSFHLVCRFAGGARGSITISVGYRVPARVLDVTGPDGQINWDSRLHRVMAYTAADRKWQLLMETASRDYSYDKMYIDEFDAFLRAVRGEVPYPRSFADVKRLLEVLVAAERSSSEGRRVSLGS